MLERKMAELTEPEMTIADELPEQESTIVVIESTDPEQTAEVSTEAVTEPSVPDVVDGQPAEPVAKPKTVGLPMVAFKPLQKDISDDGEVPYAPPMAASPIFADDDDEFGVQQPLAPVRKAMTEEEIEAFEADLDAKAAAATALREAEEKARKEKEAEDETKRNALLRKRKHRRILGNIMMTVGAVGVIVGAVLSVVAAL